MGENFTEWPLVSSKPLISNDVWNITRYFYAKNDTANFTIVSEVLLTDDVVEGYSLGYAYIRNFTDIWKGKCTITLETPSSFYKPIALEMGGVYFNYEVTPESCTYRLCDTMFGNSDPDIVGIGIVWSTIIQGALWLFLFTYFCIEVLVRSALICSTIRDQNISAAVLNGGRKRLFAIRIAVTLWNTLKTACYSLLMKCMVFPYCRDNRVTLSSFIYNLLRLAVDLQLGFTVGLQVAASLTFRGSTGFYEQAYAHLLVHYNNLIAGYASLLLMILSGSRSMDNAVFRNVAYLINIVYGIMQLARAKRSEALRALSTMCDKIPYKYTSGTLFTFYLVLPSLSPRSFIFGIMPIISFSTIFMFSILQAVKAKAFKKLIASRGASLVALMALGAAYLHTGFHLRFAIHDLTILRPSFRREFRGKGIESEFDEWGFGQILAVMAWIPPYFYILEHLVFDLTPKVLQKLRSRGGESSAGVEPSPAVELQRYIVRHPPPPKTNVNNVEVQGISGSQIAHEQHQALLPPDPNMAS